MNNVAKFQPMAVGSNSLLHDEKMIALVRRTVAKDCNDDEFNIFMAMCRATNLDPLRKQCYAFVFKKGGRRDSEPEQRSLTLVTSINGFRTIADRTGNYRPDEDAAQLYFDKKLNSETNPLGIEKAIGRVWKFSHGDWHKVTVEAYWEEYAPIKEEWAYGEDGKRRPTGKKTLDTSGQWGKMPRLMLAKCGEAAALRKAFPDELSNIHEEAEIDRVKFIDILPSELAQQGETNKRLERIGGAQNIVVDWLENDMMPLDLVPIGTFADRAAAFIEHNRDEPSRIALWRERNQHALKEFWARAPTDALGVKKLIEKSLGDAT